MKGIHYTMCLISAICSLGAATGHSDPEIDYEQPAHGVFEGQWPAISKIKVFVTGPKVDFDSYLTIHDLLLMSPVYISTNSVEINTLLAALHDHKNDDVNTRKNGYTHHFILFEENSNVVMHFRIFSQDLNSGEPALVYPRSTTKFGYSNGAIIPWIKNHYSTNDAYLSYLKIHPLK